MGHDNIQKMVLIRPVNEPSTAESTYAPRVADLSGKRLGLLDNSKLNANKMLDAVATILDREYGFSNIVRHRKVSASKPVAPEAIESLSKSCDVVIVGVGD